MSRQCGVWSGHCRNITEQTLHQPRLQLEARVSTTQLQSSKVGKFGTMLFSQYVSKNSERVGGYGGWQPRIVRELVGMEGGNCWPISNVWVELLTEGGGDVPH